MTTFKQQSGVEFPGWLSALGFTDESWGNDAGARATYRTAADTAQGEYAYPVVFCWCFEADPDEREMPCTPRFSAFVARTYEEFEQNDGMDIYAGEDPAACEAELRKWQAGFRPLPPLAEMIDQVKREIIHDVQAGDVPATCATYSELHDYVDANGYGGAFEFAMYGACDTTCDYWNNVTDAVDQWLRDGCLPAAVETEELMQREGRDEAGKR
jgi:hypothetical protein